MRIALVAPAPDPPIVGGAENLHAGLVDYLNRETEHVAELIRIPVRETSLADLVAGYEAFSRMDVTAYDAVISTKYPAWMVRHPNHAVYMLHRCRGFYDWYPVAALGGTEYAGTDAAIRSLIEFTRQQSGARESLPEFFERFKALLTRESAQGEIARHPSPLGRAVIHYLDGVGLAPSGIRRYAAIAATVKRRPEYFPKGVRVAVLHPPTEKTGFHTAGDDYFFTVSRLYPSKRIDLLIDAFLTADLPLPFKIAGTGDEEARLRERARGDARIEFLGFVDDGRLADLYAGALAVPFVPADEDFGYIALEAMLSGKAVITTTDAGGPLELVRHGENGWVAEPNAASLARAMQRTYSDPAGARAMGARGQLRASRVRWSEVVPRLLDDAPTDRTRVAPGARRPKVTVLNAYSVHPPNHGGRYRMHWLYRTLARHVDVDLVTLGLREEGNHTLLIEDGFREIRVARSEAHERADHAAHVACGVPVYDIAALENAELTPDYRVALERSLADSQLAVLAHPYMLGALRSAGYSGPFIHESQNCELDLKRRMLPPGEASERLLKLAQEAEGYCCREAKLVYACSAEDASGLLEQYHGDPATMMVIPNGTDTASIAFADRRARTQLRSRLGIGERPLALFLASGHGPNLAAAERLFEIALQLPQVVFALVGNVANAYTHRALPENIWLVGIVSEEARNIWLHAASVALNPMLYGGGTNLKLLDYFAAGTPVISTEVGMRGTGVEDGLHLRVAPIERFGVAIMAALQEREVTDRLAVEARALVVERFDWWRLGDRLHQALLSRGVLRQ